MKKPTSPPGDAHDRLLQLARERRVSLTGLSQMLGRNPTYLQQFIRKRSPRKLEEGDRRRLAEFFGVSEHELGAEEEKSYVSEDLTAGRFVAIPRLPISAAAGAGRFADSERPFDHFGFSARWLRDNGLERARLSVVTVEGDSMEPLLRKGDDILVDRSPAAPRDGIHVVRLDDTLLVKRLALAGRGHVALLSENPAYPPVEVALGDLEIIGRVVWKGGRI